MLFYFENKKDLENEKNGPTSVYHLNPSSHGRYEFYGSHTLDKTSTHEPNISLQHSIHSTNPKVTNQTDP